MCVRVSPLRSRLRPNQACNNFQYQSRQGFQLLGVEMHQFGEIGGILKSPKNLPLIFSSFLFYNKFQCYPQILPPPSWTKILGEWDNHQFFLSALTDSVSITVILLRSSASLQLGCHSQTHSLPFKTKFSQRCLQERNCYHFRFSYNIYYSE